MSHFDKHLNVLEALQTAGYRLDQGRLEDAEFWYREAIDLIKGHIANISEGEGDIDV